MSPNGGARAASGPATVSEHSEARRCSDLPRSRAPSERAAPNAAKQASGALLYTYDHSNRSQTASEKFDVACVPAKSRNQHWKTQVSPG